MLCGTDMILTLDTWHSPERIFELSYPVYIRREDDREMDDKLIEKITEYRNRFGKNVVRLNAPAIDISSSNVRKLIANGEDVSEFMPESVWNYIKEKGLYKNGNPS